jgi:2-oxo-4-hydroxy-4-carboxy--5-ureidoimidazoline (OHCU) decarboxylase
MAARELAAAMRPLWEDAGPLVPLLVGVEVGSWAAHIDRAEQAIAAMDPATRAVLLRAHPRIGAPPVELARRSVTSLAEQGGAAEEPAVLARLAAGNDAYEARFGFPFVEFVAGRSRRSIIAVLEDRLRRDRDTELAAGCEALVAIARDRLRTHQTA